MDKREAAIGDAERQSYKKSMMWPMQLASMVAKSASNPIALAGLALARMRGLSRLMWGRKLPWAKSCRQRSLIGRAGSQSRAARLFMPDSAGPGAPLVVMLHGCMQDSQSFERLSGIDAMASKRGFNVLHPDQEGSANPMLCWNWNTPENQSRLGGEPEALADLIKQAQALCGSKPANTRLLGLSAGAALGAAMAHLYPELLGSVASVAGPAPFTAKDLPSAIESMAHGPEHSHRAKIVQMAKQAGSQSAAPARLPVLIVQGGADETVNPKHASMQEFSALSLNAALALRRAQSLGSQVSAIPAKRSRSEGPAGSFSLWTDFSGAPIACVVRPKELGHAWSGGLAGEPFGQEGFDQTAMAIDFFEAVESGDLAKIEPSAIMARVKARL